MGGGPEGSRYITFLARLVADFILVRDLLEAVLETVHGGDRLLPQLYRNFRKQRWGFARLTDDYQSSAKSQRRLLAG